MSVIDLKAVVSNILRLPAESITDDTSPQNTPNWDSLRHVELVMAVESAFLIEFSMPEIATLNSVGDIRRLLAAKRVLA